MPNPLLGMVPKRRDPRNRYQDTSAPQPITPVLEGYAGSNHPYRGLEQHGVQDTVEPNDPETYGFDVDDPNADGGVHFVPVQEDPKEPEPIPVKVIQEFKRELRTFATDRLTISGSDVKEIIGRDTDRSSFKLRNLTADKTLVVCHSREDMSIRGFYLYAGTEISLTTEEPVYVQALSALDADAVLIGIIAEYVRKES